MTSLFRRLLLIFSLIFTTMLPINSAQAIAVDYDTRQIKCLAENIYFEARGEPYAGKLGVANVVMNRVSDDRFPSTPCGVVNQRTKKTCQFSWVCNRGRINNLEAFEAAQEIAEEVYYDRVDDVTGGAKFFHNRQVRPSWAKKSRMTTRIGQHLFYR